MQWAAGPGKAAQQITVDFACAGLHGCAPRKTAHRHSGDHSLCEEDISGAAGPQRVVAVSALCRASAAAPRMAAENKLDWRSARSAAQRR